LLLLDIGNLGWRDDVGKDARILGIRSFFLAAAVNREEWEKLLKEAKTL
jgi:hypothetical protein